MSYFLQLAAFCLVLVAGAGLYGVRRMASAAQLMMGLQLLGSAGVAILLVLSAAVPMPALADAAVTLALLAAVACAALHGVGRSGERGGSGEAGPQ